MNTCLTCKHWRKIRDEDAFGWPGPHGECLNLDEFSTDKTAWLWFANVEKDNCGDLSLVTKPDFGCTLWEEK